MAGSEADLGYLLDFDGETIVYEGGYTARFRARRVGATPERPHGIEYSITLHAPSGRRILGSDHAHRVRAKGRGRTGQPAAYDHWHRSERDRGRPYHFASAEK